MREFDVIAYLIYHCTGTTQNASVEAIVNYWRTQLGWRSGGYQIIVDPRGVPYFYDGSQNPYIYTQDRNVFPDCLKYITNGVRGYNWNSIHMSWIGGKGGVDNRTIPQKETMYVLSKKIIDLIPSIELFGHRDFSKDIDGNGIITPDEWSKDCPSMDTIAWLNKSSLYNYLLSK